MQPFETILVETTTVACNGGGGALGHQKVFLALGPGKRVECPYCSRLYVLEAQAHPHPPGPNPADAA